MVPNGWEKHPVGKICSSIVPGRNKPKQFGGDIAWVTTPEITGKFIPSSVQKNYISEETIKECGGKVVPKGAVVMAAVGDLGLIAITKEEVVLNQQLHAFVCSSKINNEFLAYWLATQTPYMESVASKTTILYLNKTNCESIPVLVPPILEQQKIAKILSTWDKAISATERLIDNSTQQKKALMQQLLTGKKRLLDESGKRFEGAWKMSSLGNLAVKVGSGKTPKGGSESYQNTGIPLIRSQNVLWGKLDLSDVAYIDEEQNKKMKGSSVFKSDVLLNITGASIGRVAISNLDEANVNQHVCIIRTNDYLDNEFLKYTLLSFEGQKQIERFQAGGNRQGLNFEQIKSFKLLNPSTEEQQKIATVLTNADKEIELLEQQLADLQQEKKALMQVLLTGKRRVLGDS